MANKKFGDTLRTLRKVKGYTQQQAADLLGLKNKSTLGSWEVGKSEPDGYTLLKLCQIYDVQDIYSAFGEISPCKQSTDNIMKYYLLLTDEYKKVIEELIIQLLEIQGIQDSRK